MPASGPISLLGKHSSARNAMKHGYSGEGKCLPPDLQAELPAAVAAIEAQYPPRNDHERDLVRQAALASVRLNRLQGDLLALGDDRARRARHEWDARREDEAAELFKRLQDTRDPAAVLRPLRRTTHGCELIADAWESLIDLLDRLGHWPDAPAYRALRLIGCADRPALDAEAPELAAFCDAIADLQFHADPEAFRLREGLARDVEALRATYGDRHAALARVRDEAVAQRDAALAPARALWDDLDGPARAEAPRLARHDPGPETARLSRYIADADRLHRRALDDLRRLHAEPPARAPEPSPELFASFEFAPPIFAPPEAPAPAPRNELPDAPPPPPAPRNELPADPFSTPPPAPEPPLEPPAACHDPEIAPDAPLA